MVRLWRGLAALMALWAAGPGVARAEDAAAILQASGGLAVATAPGVADGDADGDGALNIVDAVRKQRAGSLRRGGSVTRTVTNRYASGGASHGVILDDPLLNGNPDARIVVTHRYVGAFNATPAVWYHAALGRWVIFNEDRSPMKDGEVFHYAFADGAAVSTGDGDFRLLLDGLDPWAIPLATHCFSAAYIPAPLALGFANPPRWYLYREDYAALPPDETFFVLNAGEHGGVAIHNAGNDYHGYGIYLDDLRLNNNPAAILLAQHAYARAPNPSSLGVWYDEIAGRWLAFNETGLPLPMGEAVHYLIAGP